MEDEDAIAIKTYKPSATVALGSDYEALLCGLYSLRCFLPNRNGCQFWIAQNVPDGSAGKFDDIVLCFHPKNKEKYALCVQTKHTQGKRIEKYLQLKDFQQEELNDGNFAISRYYESIKPNAQKEVLAGIRKLHYILFTNRIVDESVTEDSINCKADFLDLLNTQTDEECTQNFQFKNFEYLKTTKNKTTKESTVEKIVVDPKFLKFLYIFANQLNVADLSELIENTLREILHVELTDNELNVFVNTTKEKIKTFFSEWAKGFLGGTRVLYKKEISSVLGFYFLENYLTNATSINLEEHTDDELKRQSLLFDIIFKREFAVVRKGDALDEEFNECRNFVIKGIKMIIKKYEGVKDDSVVYTDQEISELFCDEEELSKMRQAFSSISHTGTIKNNQKLLYILWIYKKVPIALQLNGESSLKQFQKLLPLCGTNKIILFIENINAQLNFDQLENCLLKFSDLDFDTQSVILQQKMMLQGRPVNVHDVVFNEKIHSEILTLHILQIIQEKFHIGGLKLPELPATFVERSLQSVLVKSAALNIGNNINKFIIVCDSYENFEEYVLDSRNNFNDITGVKIQNLVESFNTKKIEYDSKLFLIRKSNLKQLTVALNNRREKGVIYNTLHLTSTSEGTYSIVTENASELAVNVIALSQNQIAESLQTFLDMHKVKYDQWDIYRHADLNLELPFNCKYIVTDDTNDFFLYKNLISNSYSTYSFRYFVLHESNDKLVEWVPTHSLHADFKRWLIKEKYDISSAVTSCYISDLNIISGGPGMGKSVLVDDLYRNGPSDMWIVPINLNAEAVRFKDVDPLAISISSEKFLKDIIKYNQLSYLEKYLFDQYFNNNKVYVLMDGFDEVVHLCENKITAFIRGLRKLNSKLLITTRPVQQSILEQRLSYFSRTINPFGIEEQKFYLTDFFEKNIDSVDKSNDYDTKIAAFIDKIIQATRNKMSAWDVNFAGIPLQTFMIATVYKQHCIDYLKTEHFKADEVNVLGLYKKFIDITIEHDEHKRQASNANSIVDYQKVLERSMNGYQLCALKYIFGDQFKPTPAMKNETAKFIDDIKAGIENFGLVENISAEGDNPIFIHRTFAEYLIATYLLKHYKESEGILNIIFSDDVYDIIRNIMDRLLAGDNELHLEVLNKNEVKTKELLETNKLTQRDLGGRSAIELASSWGARHRIPEEDLLNNNHDNGFVFGNDDSKYSFSFHKAAMGTEAVLQLILNCSKEFSYENDIIASFSTILNFSIDCLALENTNILLGYVPDKSVDISECIERLLNKCSSTSSNMKFRQLLYICCMYDYNSIASQLIKLYPDSLNLNEINYGPNNDDMFFVSGLYGSNRMLNLLISIMCENEEEYSSLKIAVSALREKDANHLKELLNTSLEKVDINGKTVLMYAAEWGYANIVTKLIEMRVNINLKDNTEKSAPMLAAERDRKDICAIFLREACRTNDPETVEFLLNANENLANSFDEKDKTPLMIAVQNKHFNIVKLLLKAGANINAEGPKKSTALIIAVQQDLVDVAGFLIESGADVTAMDNRGRTPLLVATQNKNAKIVRTLLKARANANGSDSNGKTAVLIATENNDEDTLKVLLEAKPNVNAFNKSGNFPLKIAVENRWVNLTDLLLSAKANANMAAKDGRTPLIIATENKDLKIMEKLIIQARANVNAADTKGYTPLLLATKAGETDIVRLLLDPKSRADVNVSDFNGDSAVLMVSKSGHSEILKLLLEESPNIDAADRFGSSALIIATSNRHLEVVRLLVEAGVNVNAADAKGNTALLIAADLGCTEIVQVLLDGNINVNAADVFGRSSLLIASQKGHRDIVELLLQKDVRVDASDKDGRSSLFYATDEGHYDIVKLLLDENANYEVADVLGETALERAIRNGFDEIGDLLRSHGAVQ